jgi:hypothetical protein
VCGSFGVAAVVLLRDVVVPVGEGVVAVAVVGAGVVAAGVVVLSCPGGAGDSVVVAAAAEPGAVSAAAAASTSRVERVRSIGCAAL